MYNKYVRRKKNENENAVGGERRVGLYNKKLFFYVYKKIEGLKNNLFSKRIFFLLIKNKEIVKTIPTLRKKTA
jgi:hypothetical protein